MTRQIGVIGRVQRAGLIFVVSAMGIISLFFQIAVAVN